MQVVHSSEIDWQSQQLQYQHDQRVCIHNFFSKSLADSLYQSLLSTHFNHAYTTNGRGTEMSDADLKAMTPQQRQTFMSQVYQQAAKGVGFLYGRHKVDSTSPDLLKKTLDYLNSEELLNKIRTLTGEPNIKFATAQATRYVGGSFLTRHRDMVPDEKRLFAYVLGFTPNWHPDCGGLLQFYQQNGTPRDAWTPAYNAMTLFDVKHIHAVTYVAPFTPQPRLTITGWFRSA
ncbi:2OG-Fe(II) oxygenase [Shewanella waksmanii]|uniref:2OG-Fe(II) oxygenase n=1 Tax=Shewanella waksmanii TaxID=213783 RepID=UPI0037353379